MARPTKLTPETRQRICDNITLGMTYEHATQAAGIDYSTFRKWILRGEAEKDRVNENDRAKIRKDELIYVEFVEALKESEARGIRNNLAMITKASKDGSWQASAWILERRHPEDYGRKDKLDMKAEHSGGVSINLKMTDCSKKEE